MKILLTIFTICILLVSGHMDAQFALAVAKNEIGSSVKYSLHLGASYDEAAKMAQKELEDLGYKNIFLLKTEENTGHDLKKGYFVLLVTSRKDYAGKLFISYGLGASAKSKQEAIERAIVHLKEFDWGYDIKFGHAIEREGEIESFYPEKKE